MKSKLWKTGSIIVLLALLLASCSSPTPTPAAGKEEAAKPSNPGGPGDAVNLTGDVNSGKALFAQNCQVCHGADANTGVANAGSDDGSVPGLAPIDESMVSTDAKVFATNIDLFIEHGSTPSGSSPKVLMTAFGDQKTLNAQQIADVIAFVISLNKPK
jgi:mono/diheme cytochrome c family protein